MTKPVLLRNPDPSFNGRIKTHPTPAQRHHHDTLHVEDSGLENCWCNCSACWRWAVWNDTLVGWCICRDCPCMQVV